MTKTFVNQKLNHFMSIAPQCADVVLPENAINITVYGLRPHQLGSTLVDKDTGDAAGDLFFFLGDRLLIPMACRHDPHW